MKAVLGVGKVGDAEHVGPLADAVDLVVYAPRFPQPFSAADPTIDCRSRVFRPLIPTTRGHQLWVYPGMSRTLDQDGPDVIHVVSEAWGTLPCQAVIWARRHPTTAVVVHAADRIWWHGGAPEIAAKRWLARRVLGRLSGFAGQTAEVIDLARPAGLPDGVPTAVVQQCSRNPSIFRPASEEERAQARERLGLPSEGVGVGFLGRFSPEKGPMEFLDAIRVARPFFAPAWVAMGGSGPMEATVRAVAAGTEVSLLGPVPFPEGVVDFYRAMDVFVAPSVRTAESEDQSPRSVIEAMMAGCVVVGSDCGAIPAMIGDVGVVTRQGDVQDLARGIIAGIAMSADEGLRASARERAVVLYSPDTAARETLELWERAIAHARAAPVAAPPAVPEPN